MLKKSFLLITVAGLMFSGCANFDFDCCMFGMIKADRTTLTFKGVLGATQDIELTCTLPWAIQNLPDWLDQIFVPTPDGATITLTTNETNAGTSPRTETFTIMAANGDRVTVTVTQNPRQTFSVTQTLTHVTSSNTATTVTEDDDFNATFSAASGHDLPTAIAVSMGGALQSVGAHYSYDLATGNLTIPNVTGDLVIIAGGVLITYAISITNDAHGTATIATGATPTAPGETIAITATPFAGYLFDKWTVESGTALLDDNTDAATFFTMPAEDVEIKAWFTPLYSLSVAHIAGQNNGYGTVAITTGAATGNVAGASVTVAATPVGAYTFLKWVATDDRGATAESTNATYTFDIHANATLYAIFTGDGSAAAPFEIATVADLVDLAADVNDNGNNQNGVHYTLVADLDLSDWLSGAGNDAGAGWDPIGNRNSPAALFDGTFDGNGHTISGLWLDRATQFAGLFGQIFTNGVVQNLHVVLADKGIKSSGGGTTDYTGGIVGYLAGQVSHCSVQGDVHGHAKTGGVVGGTNSGSSVTVSCCSFTGTVDGSGSHIGGVVGELASGGSVTNCYATGEVSGLSIVGGIVGYLFGTVTNCYATGKVSAVVDRVGGVAGTVSGELSHCVALNPILTHPWHIPSFGRVAGLLGGTGVLNDNWARTGMGVGAGSIALPAGSGHDHLNGADCDPIPNQAFYEGLGWDFTNVWVMGADGYPKLR